MEFFRQEYWSGLPFHSPGDLPDPGMEPQSPALQADSLPSEPPEKPKNTGVSSPSPLQEIFPTQETNQGLLHYRQILYQLSYHGSPVYTYNESLLLSRFSRVRLCATPYTAAHQAPPSLGFSKQEHWIHPVKCQGTKLDLLGPISQLAQLGYYRC